MNEEEEQPELVEVMLPLQEVEGVTEMVLDTEVVLQVVGVIVLVVVTVLERQRVGVWDAVKEEEAQPELVDVMLPLIETLGLPLPVLDTEVVLQVVGDIVLVVVTVLERQRVEV